MTWPVIVHALKEAWGWVKRNLGFVLLCVVGMITGAKLLRRKDSEITTLKDAVAANKVKAEIEVLRGRREELMKAVVASKSEDLALAREVTQAEAALVAQKKKLLAMHTTQMNPNTMSDAEVEEYFRRAGL